MPYVPTSWEDLGEDLKRLFREITCFASSNVSVILREAINQSTSITPPAKSNFIAHCIDLGISENDTPLIESCWDFVDYQLNRPDMCGGNAALFTNEGFQTGSPWHGDILNAPVLFLSFNPAVTQGCYFPRWHVGNDTFTFAGNGTPAKSDQQVYEFLRDRLINTYIDYNGTPHAWTVQGSSFPVSYWRGMYKTMNILAGISQGSRTIADHCRRLMRSVLSAEIIFWGSKKSECATETERLLYFWERFTVPMLEKCGAKIIFLTGGPSHRVFHETLLANGGIYTPKHYRNRFGEDFVIAAINHISTETYKNYDAVAKYLRTDQPGIVPQALSEIQRLYHS